MDTDIAPEQTEDKETVYAFRRKEDWDRMRVAVRFVETIPGFQTFKEQFEASIKSQPPQTSESFSATD